MPGEGLLRPISSDEAALTVTEIARERKGHEKRECAAVLHKGFETIDCGFHAANAPGCCCSV